MKSLPKLVSANEFVSWRASFNSKFPSRGCAPIRAQDSSQTHCHAAILDNPHAHEVASASDRSISRRSKPFLSGTMPEHHLAMPLRSGLLLLLCILLSWFWPSFEQPPSPSPTPTPSPSSQVPINRSEIATLLNLRSVLGVRSRNWPRKTDPCFVWTGIACENGHVVSITLTGLRRTVTGALHPAFALDPLQNLTHLRSLNSSGFALPGSIPDWFGSLTNLQVLDFTSASINSSIPSSLGGLSNLQIFILARNNLTGDIPSIFESLRNITTLDLSFNALTGPIPITLANLQNLQMLNLTSNQLVGNIPGSLENLLKLQFLMLAGNGLQGSLPAELGNLSFLSSLDLGSNALNGRIPAELGSLTSLNTLVLSKNSFNETIPAEISNCTSLQVLSLNRNSLSGTVPSSLGLLSNLTSLDLSSNSLTGVLPAGFSNFTKAREISLSNNIFYGLVPLVPANLPSITKLDLSNNYFEGTLPSPFVTGAVLDENCFSSEPNQHSFDVCKKFYSDRGIPFQGTIESPPNSEISANNTSTNSNHLAPILGGALGGLVFVLLIMLLMFLVIKRERSRASGQRESVAATHKEGPGPQPFAGNISVNLSCLGEKFSYTQLQQATASFNDSNLLKAGHSGDLYRGILQGGPPIVVKRIDLRKFKRDGYLAELELFGKASHTRLVPVLGHCLELTEDEKFLVYKYMPNRDLGLALHRRSDGATSEDTLQSLDWITRLKIAIGAAEGLSYLHHECTPPLVHRDIQASSILLDDKFEVRLGSLTEACVAVGETHQGVIARILRRSQTSDQGEAGGAVPTCAYDVYCFGKVLLELVSGKLGISGSTDPSTDAWLEWALPFINIYDKESMSKIVDPSLIVDEDLMEEVWAMAIVAKSCLNPKPSKRPLMRYILKALENPLKVVREDTLNGSARSRTSSHGSWNAALFGSWRHSSSETVAIPGSLREEFLQKNSSKHTTNGGSQGSGQGEVSQRRPASSEIFPEPEESAAQPPNTDSDRQNS